MDLLRGVVEEGLGGLSPLLKIIKDFLGAEPSFINHALGWIGFLLCICQRKGKERYINYKNIRRDKSSDKYFDNFENSHRKTMI